MSNPANLHGAVTEGRDLSGVTVAGKYLVKRRIGAGGMGAVYEGEHVEIGKRVAIKVIESEHAKSGELASRFRREARAASAVESEHIVHVFDVGHDEQVGLYMVMEILSGSDVATRLERAGGALPLDEAIAIVQQAARGLAKAHAAGVVHRDLKPANLFLTTREDGSPCVKILDFGISKLVRPDSTASAKQSSLTREGVVIGTPQYMSPEQAQGLAVDHRTDVWSLGAVAYEIFSGQPAFAPRDTYEQMIVQIVTTKPKPLREVAPKVPIDIAAIVDAALVSDLSARLPDATTFARRLSEAAKLPTPSSPDLGHAATVAVSAPAVAPRAVTNEGMVVQAQTAPGASKKPIAIVAGIFLAAALAVTAVVIASKKTPETAPSAGIVAPPPSVAVSSEPVAKLAPLAPTPAETPSASASAPAAKPAVKAVVVRPSVTTSAKPTQPSGQYGAAGVSTAY